MSSNNNKLPQNNPTLRDVEHFQSIVEQWGGLANIVRVFSLTACTPLVATKERIGGVQMDLGDARHHKGAWVNRVVVETTFSDYFRVWFLVTEESDTAADDVKVVEFYDEVDNENAWDIIQGLANCMRRSLYKSTMALTQRKQK